MNSTDSQRLADLTFDRAQDGMLLVDQFGQVKRSNDAAEAILGQSLADEDIDAIFGSKTRRYLTHVVNRGAARFETELAGGTYVDVRLTLVECSPVTILFAVRDATALYLAREGQRRLAATLAERRRTEQLGEFIGGIAHDFNNLLTPILVNSQILSEASRESAELRELSCDIHLAASLAAQLVENIRTLNRPIADHVVANLKQAMQECQKLVVEDEKFSVRWECDVAPEWTVAMLPADFIRILLNLLKNARDACESGGECVVVGQVHTGAKHSEFILEIKDSGLGIPETIKHRIFDPYFTTKPRDRGTGLGLPMVRALLQDIGGSIDVQSATCGASFLIRLPVKVETLAPKPKPLVASLKDIRVLLVDDDSMVLRALGRILSRAGASVAAESYSPDALLRIQEGETFDLVITDYSMPDMTGLALAKKIRHLMPNMPVVMCSGQICSDENQDELRTHTKLMLAKPVGRDFIAQLTTVLELQPL
jgi:signal transduction histidine kinase